MTRGAGAVRRLIEGRLFFFEEIRYVIDIYLAFFFLEDETKQYIYHSFPCFLLYKIVSLSRAPGGGGGGRAPGGTFQRPQEYMDFII